MRHENLIYLITILKHHFSNAIKHFFSIIKLFIFVANIVVNQRKDQGHFIINNLIYS